MSGNPSPTYMENPLIRNSSMESSSRVNSALPPLDNSILADHYPENFQRTIPPRKFFLAYFRSFFNHTTQKISPGDLPSPPQWSVFTAENFPMDNPSRMKSPVENFFQGKSPSWKNPSNNLPKDWIATRLLIFLFT